MVIKFEPFAGKTKHCLLLLLRILLVDIRVEVEMVVDPAKIKKKFVKSKYFHKNVKEKLMKSPAVIELCVMNSRIPQCQDL